MKILLVVFLFSGYAYSEKPVCKDWILIASDWKKNANNIKKLAVKDPYCKTFSYKEWVGKYQKLIKAEEQFLKKLKSMSEDWKLTYQVSKSNSDKDSFLFSKEIEKEFKTTIERKIKVYKYLKEKSIEHEKALDFARMNKILGT